MADDNYIYGMHADGGKYAYADRITIDRTNERDPSAQLKAGGELRQPGDDGMHLISRVANGAKGEENLVAGSHSINRGSYKSMEQSVIKAAENNPDGKVGMRVDTFCGKDRPDVIQVENTLTDKYGEMTDRQTESWTNQSNSMDAAQYMESGTEFAGYNDSLTEEERALADEIQGKIDSGTIRINTGLDTGWQYHHYEMEDNSMGKAHDDFVSGLKVDVEPVRPGLQGGTDSGMGGREREDGPGMGGRDGDFKGGEGTSSYNGPVGTGGGSESGPSEAISTIQSAASTEGASPEPVSSAIEGVQSEASSGISDTSESDAISDSGGECVNDNGLSGADDGMAGP